jgi:hypothetical protein
LYPPLGDLRDQPHKLFRYNFNELMSLLYDPYARLFHNQQRIAAEYVLRHITALPIDITL